LCFLRAWWYPCVFLPRFLFCWCTKAWFALSNRAEVCLLSVWLA
jgi:hypothetical protein